MGQACGCGEQQEDRIKELEQLLAAEKDDYQRLEENYNKICSETEELQQSNKKSSSKIEAQIKALESEKKQVFKEMMKEKKRITKLDVAKSTLENKKRNMERQINEYKQQIAKFKHIEESATSKSGSTVIIPPSPSERGYDDDIKTPEPSPTPVQIGGYDVITDIDEINKWLASMTGDKKKDHKQFNKKMTELFTKRSDQHRLQIAVEWYEKERISLIDRIDRKLDGKTRGVPFRVLSGLLQTPSEIDAKWINECIYNDWQISKVADVICSRGLNEITLIKQVYKKQFNKSLGSMLDKLAKHHNKNTMENIFKNLLNVEYRERNNKMQTKEKVNMIEIGKHVEWMINTKGFKHAEKEKMAELLCINSNDYISILAKQYKLKSKYNEDIGTYIRSKFGLKSVAGQHLRNHVLFVLNSCGYFADKIQDLGENNSKFKTHNLELINIFLSRFQTDLNQIRLEFNKNNTKDLHHFIKENGGHHNSTYFLMKILDNSKRFA